MAVYLFLSNIFIMRKTERMIYMSQYLNFFVRIKDGFIPIGDYSRNSIFYQMVNSCIFPPYEKIMPVSIQQLKEVCDNFKKIKQILGFK